MHSLLFFYNQFIFFSVGVSCCQSETITVNLKQISLRFVMKNIKKKKKKIQFQLKPFCNDD